MRFIYAADDADLARQNPDCTRIYVTGLGSICAFYEKPANDWPPALKIPGLASSDRMAALQLIHDIEANFARQMGFEHNRRAFDGLSFADLITLTREADAARQQRNREMNIQPEGIFSRGEREPRRKLASRGYHRHKNDL